MKKEDIEEIFELWKDFTGIDPSASSKTITPENECIHSYNESIEEAASLGDVMDALLVMGDCFDDYVEKHLKIPMADIMGESNYYMDKILTANRLQSYLNGSEMKKYRWALERTLDDVRKNYEISHDLDAKEQLFLYLKAKKSLKEMECVSFREGKKSRDPWKYVKAIRIYDSINTLLADAVATDFNGVMLNAVTDRENAAYSYFCFVIKNGDNIVMVSDRPNVNFLRKYCGRSHGKQMEGRIMKHMFPYEILGLEMTKHNVKMTSTELSDKAFIGSTISQINPFSGFWVACCLSLLQDMFMGGQMDGAPHVYSGGMVSVPLDSHASLPQPVDGDASLALRDAFGTLSET